MKNDLSLAIKHLSSERGLPREIVVEAIEAALVSAYKKTPAGNAQNVTVWLDPQTGKPHVFAEKEVVEEVHDDRNQITLPQARRLKAESQLGETVQVDVTPADFGRIAAQTAKQVILQRIREAERDQLYAVYKDQEGEIVQGVVQAIEQTHITIALDKAEAILPRKEQIPRERYHPNQRLRVYIVEVKKTNKGPEIVVSRTHRAMLRRLLELEVPEIFNGTVEIKAIAREAGSRSKVAVATEQDGVDPVGACVGLRGVRIQALVNELGGEKIDVIEWNSDASLFIAKALSPAMVLSVKLAETPDGKTANVIVPDKQLSLAIGKEGQNARLAAKLTGWRIDIKSESEAVQAEDKAKAAKAAELEQQRVLEEARKLLEEAAAADRREAEEPEAEAPESVEEIAEPAQLEVSAEQGEEQAPEPPAMVAETPARAPAPEPEPPAAEVAPEPTPPPPAPPAPRAEAAVRAAEARPTQPRPAQRPAGEVVSDRIARFQAKIEAAESPESEEEESKAGPKAGKKKDKKKARAKTAILGERPVAAAQKGRRTGRQHGDWQEELERWKTKIEDEDEPVEEEDWRKYLPTDEEEEEENDALQLGQLKALVDKDE